MKQILKSHHPVRHVKSFGYAFKGVFHALLNEANFRVQVVIVAAAISAGIYLKINTTEWGLIIISMGLLISAEMINTVVEEFMDYLSPEESANVGVIKDLSAGFVLITAITVLLILGLIFGPKFYQVLM